MTVNLATALETRTRRWSRWVRGVKGLFNHSKAETAPSAATLEGTPTRAPPLWPAALFWAPLDGRGSLSRHLLGGRSAGIMSDVWRSNSSVDTGSAYGFRGLSWRVNRAWFSQTGSPRLCVDQPKLAQCVKINLALGNALVDAEAVPTTHEICCCERRLRPHHQSSGFIWLGRWVIQ